MATEMNQRLRWLRELRGISVDEVAKRLKIGKSTAYLHENPRDKEKGGELTVAMIRKYAEIYGSRPEFIAFGHEPPFEVGKKAPKADEILRANRESGMKWTPRIVGSFDPDEDDPIPDDDLGGRPLRADGIVEIDVRAGMGDGGVSQSLWQRDGESSDPLKHEAWVFPSWFLQSNLRAGPEDLLAVEAQGDSMEPTIDPGSVVFVDTRHKIPSPDGIYAIRDRWGHIQVKRIESFGEDDSTIRIISDNGRAARSVPIEEVSIVGKVVACWRKL